VLPVSNLGITESRYFKVNEGEPNVMWLSGLHIPESYLTALVQATCRKNGWPLDKSTLYTTVTDYQDADDVNERAMAGKIVTNSPSNQSCVTDFCWLSG